MKWMIYVFVAIVLSLNVMAIPQVIFSSFNITIDATSENITYTVINEGVEATETLPITLTNDTNLSEWTFHYFRDAIPVTFSRDVCENLDTGVLINALVNTNNISQYWIACVQEKENCTMQLGAYQVDSGYKDNYTDATNKLNDLKVSIASKEGDAAIKDKEISNLKFHRMVLIGIVLVAGYIAYSSWRKVTPKTLDSPGLSQLPRHTKM